MPNIRDKARIILDQAVPEGKIFKSNDPPIDGNHFTRYTNYLHSTMLANWRAGGIETACNGFVNWYGRTLGITKIANWFKLRQSLDKIGRLDAWVAATANAPQPKYGDILKHRINHVDVAIGFRGNILRREAAGQDDGTPWSTHPRPRPAKEILQEYDVLRRVDGTKPYNWQNLEGWLDIEIYFRAVSQQKHTDGKATDTESLWLNGDGEVVHPDAPDGGWGPGFFRFAGDPDDLFGHQELPHPRAPAGRNLDPLALRQLGKKYDKG